MGEFMGKIIEVNQYLNQPTLNSKLKTIWFRLNQQFGLIGPGLKNDID